MPTRDRRSFVAQAISYFGGQDYPHRELIIVDDGGDSIRGLLPDDPHIHYLRLEGHATIGAKRNLACRQARGEIIVHWDDDDWMAGWRLRYQVENLRRQQADVCGLDSLLWLEAGSTQAWQYVYPKAARPWLAGGTLCYTKALWRENPFPEIGRGEDTRFVWSHRSKKLLALEDNTFYVALIHPGNTSPKRPSEPRWQPYAIEKIQRLLGQDWTFYAKLQAMSSDRFDPLLSV